MDPTTACNLHCTGCWVAEYGNKLNMDYETLSEIVVQGRELGVYMYIFSGGEPLVRKKDIIKLCETYSDCEFLAFTNGTLIDEEFADDMLRVKNFVPAISVEGFENATDLRRGNGTFRTVLHAMEILRKKRLPFGVSCCYTSANVDSISSEEFIDFIIEQGAKFAWYFHYMPVGNEAVGGFFPHKCLFRVVVSGEVVLVLVGHVIERECRVVAVALVVGVFLTPGIQDDGTDLIRDLDLRHLAGSEFVLDNHWKNLHSCWEWRLLAGTAAKKAIEI